MSKEQFILIGKNSQINLNDNEQSFYLQPDMEGVAGLPEIRVTSGENLGQDGSWTVDPKFGGRFMSITTTIANEDIAIVEQKRRELTALLAERTLKVKYVTSAGLTYTTDVTVMKCDVPIERLLKKSVFKINLVADDPIWYDNGTGAEIIARLYVQKSSSGFTIPFIIPFTIGNGGGSSTIVTNTGNTAIHIIMEAHGALHEPTIINQTTGKQIKILADLVDSDVLMIDTKDETITLNGTDKYYLKSDTSAFFKLEAGDNEMVLKSNIADDAGYVDIKYKSGSIGI